MRRNEVVTQFDRAHALHHFADEQGIAQRLAHLFASSSHPRVVQPVVGKAIASGFALGNFIFVVRENQIESTTMDVKASAEILFGHC